MCKVFSLHVFRIQSFLWIADRNSPQGSLQIQCTALALPDVESISRESAVPVKSSFPAALSTGVFWCSNPGQQSPCQLIRLRRDPRTFQQSTGLLEPGGTLTARTCCSRPRWCTGKVEAPRDVATKRKPYVPVRLFFGAAWQSKSELIFASAKAVLRSSKVMVLVPSL